GDPWRSARETSSARPPARAHRTGRSDMPAADDCAGRRVAHRDRVRRLLFEAANVILYRTKTPSRLRRWAQAIALRSGSWKARVALARKLATVLFRMMRDGVVFEPEPSAG
ncbi:MAG: IS110 family transposase, partial [Pseudomonadota bacterium]